MATSINAYSVRLGMDASGFIDATKISRAEARMLTRDIEAAQSPMERFAAEQDRLSRALQAGAIDQGTYNRLLESKRPAVAGVTSALGPMAAALAAVSAATIGAAVAGKEFVSYIRDVQNRIDDTADKAGRLGVSFKDLRSFEFGFARGGGVSADAVGESLKKFQINIAKAVDGDTGLREAFKRLGLDAGQLMADGPKEAMLKVADAMANVADHGERMKLSMDLFGKSGADLASTLGKGRQELQASVDHAEKWLGLTEQQVEMVGANNDAWEDVSIVLEGVSQKLAAEMAPAMQMIAEDVLGVADGMNNVDQYLRNAVSNSVIIAGTFKDIADRLAAFYSNPFAEIDMSNERTGLRWYAQLENNRAEARKSAADKATKAIEKSRIESEEKVAAKQKEDFEKYEQAWFKIAEQEQRQRRQMASQALAAAEEKFAKEAAHQAKLQADVAKGPGAGMAVGSAEAARYMAQQANAAIAESAVKVDSKPTDQQLVEEAKKQLQFLQSDAATKNNKLDALVKAIEENGGEGV